MHTEIEAKFLHIDHEAMRSRLQELGATCERPECSMTRQVYDLPTSIENSARSRAFVRVRDEGDKITMTYKQIDDRGLHGTKEVNLAVDSFEQACAMLEAIGLQAKSYQETKRESWKLNGVEIELDQWPWIPPLLEIEGKDETAVRDTAAKLGLAWENALHGSVEVAYQAEYDVTEEDVNTLPAIAFDQEVPAVLQDKKRKVTA